ncbi:zinc-dependent metalloprotease [Isoptericola sp. NEAU-Y5]|uniref:Zinc-dependent metalloprotease n=1 Tax=Isoptericola luteus TaxID=2879484 RepID=A0ABS7ZDG2_9MICO|nr:zinc-dependent metalloprotease [Isoptericola sp. NEAU-Y5]MCA5893080.1 zinc-dependent metalloprotease [Isoptericola sp. NEAU-Y5]
MTSPAVSPRVAPEPLLDWTAAAQVAGRLARPGPMAPRAELDNLVGGLRDAAGRAVDHVLTVTRMVPAGTADLAGGQVDLGDVHVVDRATWARANMQSMRAMTDPVAAELGAQGSPTSAAARLAGAAEVGGLLALLSGRVLGQFDPYGQERGRLLLVAPNVLAVERALNLRPQDFRLWVCLHEQTHALQFATAPWLADHLRGRVEGLLGDVTSSSAALAKAPLRRKLAVVADTVLRAVRGELVTPLDGILGPEQRRELEEITAVMALLEGHADVMMDAVGPRAVRSVKTIRARFEKRRDGDAAPALDLLLRRVLGLDAKLAQYRDGAAFVREVEEIVGRQGLNAVWAAPEHLPSAREISDARAWVRRVHG